jgi:hypothetical protein
MGSQLKQYGKGDAPFKKNNAMETSPKVNKGSKAGGEMYKAPKGVTLRGAGAKDQSSGRVEMHAQSASDKNRHTQAVQPKKFAQEGVGTKFVC